ncbi:MAG: SMC-Scp complex subunit ScpB [Candidatus Hodarchaeota archaeon]
MFRLFRRRKKEKKQEKTIDEITVTEELKISNDLETSPEGDQLISEESSSALLKEYSIPETPFEEKFAAIPQIVSETITDEFEPPKLKVDMLPFARAAMESEVSIYGFVSPELLKQPSIESDQLNSVTAEIVLPRIEYPPVSLEERIEGALFSIGRPIHVSELIENFEEESPIIKRSLRKLQRRRKRTSPIVIDEISRDRWVLHLNPIYSELFSPLYPENFMEEDERRIVTEICYRQPISLAMVKKMVPKYSPVRVTEVCKRLEARGYIIGEKKARSLVYTSTPKFAHDFGFDDESRRLKLQMLWRLKRLMGDFEPEEEEEEEATAAEVEETKVEIVKEEMAEVKLDEEKVIETESEEEVTPAIELTNEMELEVTDDSGIAKDVETESTISVENDSKDVSEITDDQNSQEYELLEEEE